ncbi:hypothetical protein [Paractinoplanes bogorensis]|uniref:hypothetical protein n=1 Tax=Paractinoplanes bogorensis TaxID=1610840 RepID=UPI0027E106D2|nr:hypothetical protein [Actinoplanes bogorensis]
MRRRLLGTAAASALAGSALAGCGLFDDEPAPPEPADPLQPLLDEAMALAASYDRAIAAQPGLASRLTPLGDDHRAHVAELTLVIGKTPPSVAPSASVGAPAETVASLREAEQAAQKSAVALCRAAVPERAALIGSIAACRATHAEALR